MADDISKYVFDDRSMDIEDRRARMANPDTGVKPGSRGDLLPTAKTEEGKFTLAFPQWARDFWNTVTLPRDVTQGYDPTAEDIAQSALDIGIGGVSSSMVAGHATDPNTLGMFLGRKAKGADTKKLAQAMSMQDQGVDRNQIWKDTGWFLGSDGKWKWEISDEGLGTGEGVRESLEQLPGSTLSGPTGDVIKHEELFPRYQNSSDPFTYPIDQPYDKRRMSPTGVKKDPVSPYVSLRIDPTERHQGHFYPDDYQEIMAQGQDYEDLRSVIVHELQHAVQEREGFSSGSSPETVKYFNDLVESLPHEAIIYLTDGKLIRNLQKKIDERKAELRLLKEDAGGFFIEGDEDEIDNVERSVETVSQILENLQFSLNRVLERRKKLETNRPPIINALKRLENFYTQTPYETYKRNVGEAEARITQKRLDYSDEKRAETHPLDELDVPEEELWDRKGIETDLQYIQNYFDSFEKDLPQKGYEEGLNSISDNKGNYAEGGMVIDPVSGNEVPPGAKPEEVRDDIQIKASEGEYVIPANVVRYIGLEKIEKMVTAAKEALGSMDDEGRMGGQVEDDSLPFEATDLQALPMEGFAEGGLVGQDTHSLPQDEGFTGTKQFKSPNGDVIFVPYQNGAPLFPIPDGYQEIQPDAVTNKAPDPNSKVMNAEETNPRSDPSPNERTNGKSPLAGSPSGWSADNFIDYGKQKNDMGTKAIRGMISVMPGGALALKVRDKYLDSQVTQLFDTMMETGVDPTGNPITPEQRSQLEQTRSLLKKQMSDQSGLNLNPIERLTDAFSSFMGFVGGKRPGQPAPLPTPSGGGQQSAPRSSLNAQGTAMVNANNTNRSDNQYSGGSVSVGSDLGKKNNGPTSGSMRSGGLYKDGGLVVRPKK